VSRAVGVAIGAKKRRNFSNASMISKREQRIACLKSGYLKTRHHIGTVQPGQELLLRPTVVKDGFERVKVAGEVLPATFKVLRDCGQGECAVYWTEPSSLRAVCGIARSASDFDTERSGTANALSLVASW
jgi:hypothetical protein